MRCTNCGWDNADQNTRCEKCNAPLENFSENNQGSTVREPIKKTVLEDSPYPKSTIRDPEEPVRSTISEPNPISGSAPVYPGTYNPYGGGFPYGGVPMMSYCKLTPLPLAPNEKHLPKELELKGEYNELNRGNLDPDNFTISQKIQAELTCKNGKWYIKDQSPYKTTYILASDEVALKSGDIILMGNRRFVFTEE